MLVTDAQIHLWDIDRPEDYARLERLGLLRSP